MPLLGRSRRVSFKTSVIALGSSAKAFSKTAHPGIQRLQTETTPNIRERISILAQPGGGRCLP